MLANQIRDSVRDTLCELASDDSYRVYLGERCERLEAELKRLIGASDCLLLSSGTAAVEVALRAAGIGAGDEVIISAYDYPGNFWAIERVGARPVLVDTEPDGWNLSMPQVKLAYEGAAGNNCKSMIVSHLHGQLQDVATLRAFCDDHKILLIEDCCQAIGATINELPVGSFGHASVLSFGGGKLVSAGRGGGLLTSDSRLAQRARIAAGAGSGPYQMSEVQAAIVLAQLQWLSQINSSCRSFFSQLTDALTNHIDPHEPQIITPYEQHLAETSFYQAGLLVRLDSALEEPEASTHRAGIDLVNLLRSQGIPAGRGFDGFHRRSARRCRIPSQLENCQKAVADTIVIHHSVVLAEALSPREIASALVATLRAAT